MGYDNDNNWHEHEESEVLGCSYGAGVEFNTDDEDMTDEYQCGQKIEEE